MSSSNSNSDHQMQAGNQNVPSQSNINQSVGSAVLYEVQGSRPPQSQNFSTSDSGEGAVQPYIQETSAPYCQAQNRSIHSNSLGPPKNPSFLSSQVQVNSYVASSSAKFSSGEPLHDTANSDTTNPISVQNGPYPTAVSSEQLSSSPFPSWNANTNFKVSSPNLQSSGSPYINGVSSNRSNLPPPTTEISPSLQWPSHIKIPPPPGTTVLSSQYGSNPAPSFQTGRNYGAQQQPPLPAVDGKIVPNPSLVPSSFGLTGLPMPYSSQDVKSSSPQITPGTSQPPSARSSRNPSPIASHRYDYMEGQFSNKPSPSNSFANLQNLTHNPGPVNSNYPAIVSSANSYSPMPPITSPTSQLGLLAKSGPSVSKQMTVTSQPVQNTTHNTIPVSAVSAPTRPRYPNQVGYNRSMPVVNQPLTSQPSSTQYSPIHNSSQLNQQSGFNSTQLNQQSGFNSPQSNQQPGFNLPQLNKQSGFNSSQLNQQAGYPEGPVGGVSGYDPHLHGKMAGMSIHSSFSRLWGNDSINLLQDRNILPAIPIEAPKPVLPQDKPNCSPKIFRSTLTKVPETSSLLQKSRLPFGVLIHPFRDVSNLPVVHCNTIVRCRNCRTYINAFVVFVDLRRWKCNLCFRINDLPEEFLYDPITRSYGDPSRRPEIKNATIEFIAPSDYMLRPPQPAVYLFLLDVSHGASETGYLQVFCDAMLNNLDNLPGDSRTRIGFITFNGSIHFYNLGEGLNQPHMLIVSDIEDVFLPSPDNLLVNLHESKSLIQDLLKDLPQRFAVSGDTNNCLGAALQAAYKLMAPIGGRIAVVQTGLPNIGPGALKNREDPNQRAAKEVTNIGPASDFYKKLALDCSTQQVGVDLFLLCSQYADVATLSCISKFSSGCVQYYPGFHVQVGKLQVEKFGNDLKRYFTRRIGLEAVMRIRCTKGLTIHTFHGNFFVRSTDLLSLPNVSPDAGFAMQIAIEDNLTEINSVCFQAAVLYTATHGERRIRVHTLCLPVVSILQDILGGADQEAIIGLVSKMAVDRSITASLGDARDALINVCIDILGVFKQTLQANQTAGMLMAPYSARLVPLFILALLKNVAFRTGVSTKLDERVFAMERMKTLPLQYLMKFIYPMMYPVHALDDKNAIHLDDDSIIPQPPILHLSSEKIDRHGAYLLDTIDAIYLFVGRAVSDHFCVNILGVPNFSAIPEELMSLPLLTTPESERLRNFISWLQSDKPAVLPFKVIREDGKDRNCFLQYMLDDRTESLFSYYEFLQHVRQQISK